MWSKDFIFSLYLISLRHSLPHFINWNTTSKLVKLLLKIIFQNLKEYERVQIWLLFFDNNKISTVRRAIILSLIAVVLANIHFLLIYSSCYRKFQLTEMAYREYYEVPIWIEWSLWIILLCYVIDFVFWRRNINSRIHKNIEGFI